MWGVPPIEGTAPSGIGMCGSLVTLAVALALALLA